MAADYKINLAKDLTSSIEGRVKFYNGMLIYLAICAALLVCVAYLASVNVKTFLENHREQRQLLATSMGRGVGGRHVQESVGHVRRTRGLFAKNRLVEAIAWPTRAVASSDP